MPESVEVAKYKIIGLVDVFDEQGNITGQLPIGSVQELPVAVGNKAVELGTAEIVVDGIEDEAADAPTGETGEVEEDAPAVVEEDEDEFGPTGETGEEEVI